MSPTLQIGYQHNILAYYYVGNRFTCRLHAYFVKTSENCHIGIDNGHSEQFFSTKMTVNFRTTYNGNFSLNNGHLGWK